MKGYLPTAAAVQDRVTTASAATLRGQGWSPGAEAKDAVPGAPERLRAPWPQGCRARFAGNRGEMMVRWWLNVGFTVHPLSL